MSVTLGLRLAIPLGVCLAATLGLRLRALIIALVRYWGFRRARVTVVSLLALRLP